MAGRAPTPTLIEGVGTNVTFSISPASGQSRLRVCARRVPAGSYVLDALPRLFPIDVNDGHVDAKLHRRMGIVSTMVLVQGHGTRWVTLAEAAANARATKHKAHVDGAAFKEADDDGNFPPAGLFAKINNFKELAVKYAVEELGGSYEAPGVPPETQNDEVVALVSQMRGIWRSQVTTLLKAQPAPDDDDDDGAVAHNDDDDDDDDQPVVHNNDNGDWAVAQLRKQQQQRFAVANQEREARHAEELAAAVKRREEAQGAAAAGPSDDE